MVLPVSVSLTVPPLPFTNLEELLEDEEEPLDFLELVFFLEPPNLITVLPLESLVTSALLELITLDIFISSI